MVEQAEFRWKWLKVCLAPRNHYRVLSKRRYLVKVTLICSRVAILYCEHFWQNKL